MRGTTAAGAPVIGIGHNEHVAWGVTSGLGDEDDLYAEQLVGDEGYRFRGKTEAMECRDETFNYRPPPADFLALLDLEVPDTSAGSHTERVCRTVHGPVQEVVEGEGIAYARKYAIWKREVGTILGLDKVNRAASIEDVDARRRRAHLEREPDGRRRPRQHRLLEPGPHAGPVEALGRAAALPGHRRRRVEGPAPPDDRPQVINPSQGWLANWNNPPSFGCDQRRRPGEGAHDRRASTAASTWRASCGASTAAGRASRRSARSTASRGTHAQQRMLATPAAEAGARRARRGDAKVVLDAILAWNGDYATTDAEGKVPPGVAAWDAFCAAAREVALARYPEEVSKLGHSAGGSHLQECATLESFGLRTLKRRGYRKAAVEAMKALEKEFGSKDPAAWKTDRPTYPAGSEGGGTFPEPFPFFDRGTWTELTELAP